MIWGENPLFSETSIWCFWITRTPLWKFSQRPTPVSLNSPHLTTGPMPSLRLRATSVAGSRGAIRKDHGIPMGIPYPRWERIHIPPPTGSSENHRLKLCHNLRGIWKNSQGWVPSSWGMNSQLSIYRSIPMYIWFYIGDEIVIQLIPRNFQKRTLPERTPKKNPGVSSSSIVTYLVRFRWEGPIQFLVDWWFRNPAVAPAEIYKNPS